MSSARDRMICAAAARLRDHEVVLVGVGAPVVAANRARERQAPNLQLVFESGAIGAVPARPPLSIGDPTLVAGAIASFSIADIFSYVIEGGRIDTAFVGAAEIDRAGRLNTTSIGPYDSPTSRLPGSGGAAEIVAFAKRVLVLTTLERRRFPERVGFVTSEPPAGTEVVVVTDRAVLTRPPGGDQLLLSELFPGETIESVNAEVGWPLTAAPDLDPHRMEGAA
ncbi:MAG: glutaconate CoA-transferase, subunit [Gaiellales bacterium]|nr:glutaconate CoA-transferase, subunit [Gaiellales bacterium]